MHCSWNATHCCPGSSVSQAQSDPSLNIRPVAATDCRRAVVGYRGHLVIALTERLNIATVVVPPLRYQRHPDDALAQAVCVVAGLHPSAPTSGLWAGHPLQFGSEWQSTGCQKPRFGSEWQPPGRRSCEQ